MPSRKLEDLSAVLVSAWNKAKAEYLELYPNSPQPFITCTFRSNEEQNELYAKGRTKPGGKVTNAKAGQSPHNFNPSYAFDIAFLRGKELDWSADLFKKFAKIICKDTHIEWGGSWKFTDMPHFQLRNWKEL